MDQKFSENIVLEEIRNYINSTYTQHYSQGKIQVTEYLLDSELGKGFILGNAVKYLKRFGIKDGKNRKDLLKAAHYLVIALGALETEPPLVNPLDNPENIVLEDQSICASETIYAHARTASDPSVISGKLVLQ